MKKLLLIVIFMLAGCATTSTMLTSDIQKVELGDTKQQVMKKIGQPDQILSKGLIEDNKEKTVWMYEVVKSKEWAGIIQPTAENQLIAEKTRQMQRQKDKMILPT